MVASASFAEFPREQLAPLGRVTLRRMFGKTGVFCDGVMLGMVRDNTLYFRVDDEIRAIFKEAEAFHHRLRLLARAGTDLRRARRASHLGARRAGSGASGRRIRALAINIPTACCAMRPQTRSSAAHKSRMFAIATLRDALAQ